MRVAQHVDDRVGLVQCPGRLPTDVLGLIRQRLRFGGVAELGRLRLERAGVQGHQGQGMREGVVRFGCDGVGELLVGQVGLQGRGMRGGRAGHRIRRAQAGARTDMQADERSDGHEHQ